MDESIFRALDGFERLWARVSPGSADEAGAGRADVFSKVPSAGHDRHSASHTGFEPAEFADSGAIRGAFASQAAFGTGRGCLQAGNGAPSAQSGLQASAGVEFDAESSLAALISGAEERMEYFCEAMRCTGGQSTRLSRLAKEAQLRLLLLQTEHFLLTGDTLPRRKSVVFADKPGKSLGCCELLRQLCAKTDEAAIALSLAASSAASSPTGAVFETLARQEHEAALCLREILSSALGGMAAHFSKRGRRH